MHRADRSKTFTSIEQALRRSRNPVLEEAVNRYRALTPLNTAWTRSVPDSLRRHARPVALQEGTLTVHAESPVWANLLRNTEHSIISSLRGSGLTEIRKLRVRIAPPPGPAAAVPSSGMDDDPEISRRFEQLRKALE